MNQLAASVNAINDAQIVDVSGTKITAGTIPASAMNTATNVETRQDESMADFVASGCVWSASSGLNGTMTAGVVYVDGKRSAVSAISSRAFTASKDTYVSASNAGVISYSEVANNAASPALPANSIWLAKVVTDGSAITSTLTGGSSSVGAAIKPRSASAINLYNPVKFSVYRTAAHTSSSSPTKVQFETETFDTGSNFDNATNYRFVAPVTGFYSFSASTGNTAASGAQYISLYVNGAVAKSSGSNATAVIPSVSGLLSLTVGDYVEVYFQGGAGSELAVGKSNCYFDGYLVSTT